MHFIGSWPLSDSLDVSTDRPWFIKCESSVSEFYNLKWSPDEDGEKDFQQHHGGPALTSEERKIHRKISWSLESGQIGDLNWEKVRE
jgi:hypothetical protein